MTRMNLIEIELSKRSNLEKNAYMMIPLTYSSKTGKNNVYWQEVVTTKVRRVVTFMGERQDAIRGFCVAGYI